jgi:class 3 adenylate cyclase/FixJ family two-component response regulator
MSKNNRLLIVDDSHMMRNVISELFNTDPHIEVIATASSGAQALEIIQSEGPDVITLDINMPEMDGLTLLTKIKEQNSLLKSIMVSAYGDMENIRIAMNRGAFDFITKPIDFNDLEITIEKTIEHVEALKKTLQAVKENNILRMYVDETVINFMGNKEMKTALFDNESIEGTAAFVDICGFTSISEKEPANKVVEMLNAYFDIMVKEIIKQDGTIDKFLGDSVMATFKGEYHIDRAIEACLSIRKAIENADIGIGMESYKPKVSIGINSGEMIWGNIGSSTLKRLDYTVIGDAVNVASRLQSAADRGQILISEANYQKVKDSFNCKKVGEIEMKNKKLPLVVYEVNG